MKPPRKIDSTAHPKLPSYSGWMIEGLSVNGNLVGLVWSLSSVTWVSPVRGQLFPTPEAAEAYQREFGLERCSVVVEHAFDQGPIREP